MLTFSHVKQSLSTLLKLWLMGGCGVEGWAGVGELEALQALAGKFDAECGVSALIPELGESVAF